MKVNILVVGKNKDEFVNLAEQEYLKRLQPYLSIKLVTIPSIKVSQHVEIKKIKNAEAEIILKRIPDNSFSIALDEKGNEFTSIEFANHLNKLLVSQNKTLYFIVGGPHGLSDKVKEYCDEIISLSKLTFTHQIIRIILLEQIYRAMTIIKGKKYHY
ncbi:MAG: 23S rRNA (pseudouridine(1915)-N(3))-methyltransferase RlmH [Candidatus Cloacimonadota bacterium]|nr:23S rRNA (pseudouridine(1915)-N(3))-methyltransferase RlmH [Candidatus Cloacimonadota bacterium]